MSQIRVIIEFNQKDDQGKPITLRAIAEKELSESEIENLDACESNLLEVSYAAMRKGMSAQMSYVSKKKALRHQALQEALKKDIGPTELEER